MKKILCIDDIKTNLFLIEGLMENLSDISYEVILAESAHEGLDILLRYDIDIILLDIMMPGVDGFEACRMIKSSKRTKNIPVIFVTANNDNETIEKCYKVGGDDYVNKPFNHIELLSRISFHLKAKENAFLLKQEKEYAQNILDLQENLILVTEVDIAVTVNKALLRFFNFKDIEEFKNHYKCISSKFIQEDGYFHLGLLDDGVLWLDEVIRLSKKEDVIVKIVVDDVFFVFNLKIVKFVEQYIITFTDITNITQQSLEYKHEASYDTLTQIYNRNMFHRLIHNKIEQKKKFVFILMDIDHFKSINDTYGHLVGDDVLKSLANLIKKHINEVDLFARWGGEEFVLAFDVGIKKGIEIANNLRKQIEKKEFKGIEHLTCSFGITKFISDDSIDSLVKRADDALYNAKESGRNLVCQG